MDKTYSILGKEIFYGTPDKKKLVATLDDDGNPVFAPGMAGAHTRKLAAWMESAATFPPPENACEDPGKESSAAEPAESRPGKIYSARIDSAAADHAERDGGEEEPEFPPYPCPRETTVFVGAVPPKTAPPPEPASSPEAETDEAWAVSQIPEDRLPPFDPALGVNTPGFARFLKTNSFTAAQTAALIKRLEKEKR